MKTKVFLDVEIVFKKNLKIKISIITIERIQFFYLLNSNTFLELISDLIISLMYKIDWYGNLFAMDAEIVQNN